jgi:glycosyltransferase involved in cell wall biosynthesis
MMDIEVYLSEYESFGVSALEASACEKPVVVNEVGGLKEVVENNITGIFVKPGNIQDAADSLSKLVQDKSLRELLGKNGRKKVTGQFSWNASVQKMLEIYNEIVKC